MKLDSKEEDVLTTYVNSCDIPNSSGTQSINISYNEHIYSVSYIFFLTFPHKREERDSN
jgi:hypothetical protein